MPRRSQVTTGFTPLQTHGKDDTSVTGFTLIEILVSIFILSFLIAGIYAVLNIGNQSYFMDMGWLDLQQQARLAMDCMIKEVRQANTVTVTYVDSDDDRITFNTPDESDVRYYRDTANNSVIREYPTGTTKILASDIASLEFSLVGNLLEIKLRADKTVKQRPISFPLTEKVGLRNMID